ncbi:glycine cleavage system aminomethyltransferase GcvT [bacterium]|nr:glycine cleavage system aminomethyltransferase GcvT [bacterium]MDC0258831.1 glycine cleavage system aminomethyltransferase GcvT [Verrucomicrobiales bacterium]
MKTGEARGIGKAMADLTDIQISPLDSRHRELGARMLPFAGWEMPIQYEGIVAEHNAVRNLLGIFDISHMGQVEISGVDSEKWLNGLLTNDVSALEDNGGQYTLMLNEGGGVIDDLILYREAADRFFLVVNASKIDEDVAWLTQNLTEGIELKNYSDDFGAFAIQGPAAESAWEKVTAEWGALPPRNGIVRLENGRIIACRTGYTGEDGFEFFAPNAEIGKWWDAFVSAGAKPCGLGSRDSLRLEKCYPLNGSDLDPDHSPLEAGLGFFVKLEKGCEFTGSDVLKKQKTEGLSQRLVAIQVIGKAPPPRHGYGVADPATGEQISELTSGGLSPTLGKGIGLTYVPVGLTKIGTQLEIDVRGRRFPCEVVKKPMV